jgi:hypothetical protein
MPSSFAVNAEPLGRVFFSPERRAALDRQRQANVLELTTAQSESVSLDGIVKCSNGRTTVWVNGRTEHERGSPTGVAAALSSGDPAKAVISSGDPPPVSLRVGETANRATGEKKDGLGGGTIVVKRTPP